jgi:hypothetical protein
MQYSSSHPQDKPVIPYSKIKKERKEKLNSKQ